MIRPGRAPPHHDGGAQQLTVSGVSDVERFDENEIVMSTSKGTLVVTGENLHIESCLWTAESLEGGGGIGTR